MRVGIAIIWLVAFDTPRKGEPKSSMSNILKSHIRILVDNESLLQHTYLDLPKLSFGLKDFSFGLVV